MAIRVLLLALLGVNGLMPSTAWAEAIWRSSTGNADVVAAEIETLYVTLHEKGLLATEPYVDARGRTIEAILRDEGRFAGGHFPLGVDSVMCKLNAAVCATGKGGQPQWSNKAGDALNIPTFRLSDFVTFGATDKPSGVSPDELLAKEDLDCSSFGQSCQEAVRALNGFNPQALTKAYAGKLIVPQKGVQVELDVSQSELAGEPANMPAQTPEAVPATDLQECVGGKDVNNARIKQNSDINMAACVEAGRENNVLIEQDGQNNTAAAVQLQTGRDRGAVIRQSDFKLPSFESRLVPSGKAETQSGAYSSEPLFAQQHELFKLLNFDFAELLDLDGIGDAFRRPVRVEVLDSWLDASHCDLGAVKVLWEDAAPQMQRAAVGCGDAIEGARMNAVVDHAAHVVGLIGAQLNSKAAAGLNPFAEVLYRQVPLENFTVPAVRDDVANKMILDFLKEGTRASVYNLSWKYRNEFGRNDTMKSAIKDVLQGALFVVAAGNDKLSFDDGGCDALPACLTELPNVITVIGLDRNMARPDVWETGSEGSNTSPKFHVGAIAADVVSTSGGNGTATMSGTSQAAPQVTAAAAYIISAYQELFQDQGPLPPIRVKNRLIYTTDLFSHLLNASLGGRLNFKRALDISNDHLTVKIDDATRQYSGVLEELGSDPDVQQVLCRKRSNGQEITVLRGDLRRMFYDEGRRLYVVFRNSVPGDRNSAVERIADCELRTQSQMGRFVADDAEIRFRSDQIVDFVSKM